MLPAITNIKIVRACRRTSLESQIGSITKLGITPFSDPSLVVLHIV